MRIVEFAGIGPGPFAAMMLSDMGADIVTIVRPGQWTADAAQFVNRGRRVVELDLKQARGVEDALRLIDSADALIEGFRPGVMERLQLGPGEVLKRNPKLVYGRMTGWGQTGPLAQAAGHDINYIAITGALDCFRGRDGDPVPPLNLVGDYGGGALFLIVGLLAALLEARASGQGQVVDAAMCDGASTLMSLFHSEVARGRWTAAPRANMLDGGAFYYQCYRCADGGYLSVGAIEPQFYANLLRAAGIDDPDFAENQNDKARWPELREKMTRIFLTRTRDEWAALLEPAEACVAAVATLAEAPSHPHLAARGTLVTHDGVIQPAPAPRFSRTPSNLRQSAAVAPESPASVIAAWQEGAER